MGSNSKPSPAPSSSWIKVIESKIPKLTRRDTKILAAIAAIAFVVWVWWQVSSGNPGGDTWWMPNFGGSHNVTGVGNQVTYAPDVYRKKSYVESDSPNHPILMANHLADSNLVKAPQVIGRTLVLVALGQAKSLDPMQFLESNMNQIALTSGTEVEELQADLEQEVKETPKPFKSSARLFAGYHTKVRVVDGKYRGHTGWVASVLIKRTVVKATADQSL